MASKGRLKIKILKCDILSLYTDGIVNAANSSLTPGSGIDGAIRKAAGPQMTTATNDYMKLHKKFKIGIEEVVWTESFNLSSHFPKGVIHVAGPNLRGRKWNRDDKIHLDSCYRSLIAEADKRGFHTLAVPFLSIGLFRYPVERGVRSAIETTLFMETTHLQEIFFACLDVDVFQTAEKILSSICPVVHEDTNDKIHRTPSLKVATSQLSDSEYDFIVRSVDKYLHADDDLRALVEHQCRASLTDYRAKHGGKFPGEGFTMLIGTDDLPDKKRVLLAFAPRQDANPSVNETRVSQADSMRKFYTKIINNHDLNGNMLIPLFGEGNLAVASLFEALLYHISLICEKYTSITILTTKQDSNLSEFVVQQMLVDSPEGSEQEARELVSAWIEEFSLHGEMDNSQVLPGSIDAFLTPERPVTPTSHLPSRLEKLTPTKIHWEERNRKTYNVEHYSRRRHFAISSSRKRYHKNPDQSLERAKKRYTVDPSLLQKSKEAYKRNPQPQRERALQYYHANRRAEKARIKCWLREHPDVRRMTNMKHWRRRRPLRTERDCGLERFTGKALPTSDPEFKRAFLPLCEFLHERSRRLTLCKRGTGTRRRSHRWLPTSGRLSLFGYLLRAARMCTKDTLYVLQLACLQVIRHYDALRTESLTTGWLVRGVRDLVKRHVNGYERALKAFTHTAHLFLAGLTITDGSIAGESVEDRARRQTCGYRYHVYSHDPDSERRGTYFPNSTILFMIHEDRRKDKNALPSELIISGPLLQEQIDAAEESLDMLGEPEGEEILDADNRETIEDITNDRQEVIESRWGGKTQEDPAGIRRKRTAPSTVVFESLNQPLPITYSRLCDRECNRSLPNFEYATAIQLFFKDLDPCNPESVLSVSRKMLLPLFSPDSGADSSLTMDSLLTLLYPHFTGIRSTKRKWYMLKNYAEWLSQMEAIRETYNIASIAEHIERLSHILKDKRKQAIVRSTVVDSVHTEQAVKQKYKRCMAAFVKEMNFQMEECWCCGRMRKNEVKKVSSNNPWVRKVTKWRRLDTLPSEVPMCPECLRSKKSGSIPQLAQVNGLDRGVLPPELQNLNWVESILIKIVRPVQSFVTLCSSRGKNTAQKAAVGSVVHRPVNIGETVQHVLDTLPSFENLHIVVQSNSANADSRGTVVSMEKVLAALIWLRDNNSFYENITVSGDLEDILETGIVQMATDVEDEDASIPQAPEGEHLLTQINSLGLMANVATLPPGDAAELLKYQLLHQQGQPVPSYLKNLEALAFPTLFPTGRGTYANDHLTKVSEVRISRARLMLKDRSFAMNFQYLFHEVKRWDEKTMSGAISIMCKKQMRGTDLQGLLQANDPSLKDIMTTMFSELRGSEAYWRKRKQELDALIVMCGPPSFFVTMNPAEWEWEELIPLYLSFHPDAEGKSIGEMCRLDPTIFVYYFDIRVKAYLKFLRSKEKPLGELLEYWYRMEGQQRGTPHAHMLLWVKGTPRLGVNTEEEIVEWIDSVITCRLPDPIKEPELYDLVDKFQRHTCRDTTCKKTHRYSALNKTVTSCRFGYPLPESVKTVININADGTSKKASVLGGVRHKTFSLLRTELEILINGYHPASFLIWRGNMDIQPLFSCRSKCFSYVTKYLAKAESKSVLDQAPMTSVTPQELWKLGNDLLFRREMSTMEACGRLLGVSFYSCSASFVFLNLRGPDERMRRLKLKKEIDRNPNGPATAENLIDNYYVDRPPGMEKMSLFLVASYFVFERIDKRDKHGVGDPNLDESDIEGYAEDEDVEVTEPNDNDRHGYHMNDPTSPMYKPKPGTEYIMEDKSGRFYARGKRKIVRAHLPDPFKDPETQALFSEMFLRLFKPFRDERKEINNSVKEYSEQVAEFMASCSANARADIDLYICNSMDLHLSKAFSTEQWKKQKEMEKDLGMEEVGAFDLPDIVVDDAIVSGAVDSLNNGQRTIFDEVMKKIADGDSLPMFISGTAGTGKSFLIKAIQLATTNLYGQRACLLAAPTGLAALAIGGLTLHTALSLEVQKGSESAMRELTPNKLQQLRVLYEHCRVLIVDEISMVSNLTLVKMHRRLAMIRGDTKRFGGLLVLALGDFFQLPPVRAAPVFIDVPGPLMNKCFDCSAIKVNYWNDDAGFTYRELTQNMRQANDLLYAELMSRLQRGTVTDEDVECLLSRHIRILMDEEEYLNINVPPMDADLEMSMEYFLNLLKIDGNAIAIFSKNEDADAFNRGVSGSIFPTSNLVELRAVDSDRRKRRKMGMLERVYQWTGYRRGDKHNIVGREVCDGQQAVPANQAGGLPPTLFLAVGSRVMLRRNLDVQRGLVNGAVGQVVSFIRDISDKIEYIEVLFAGFTKPEKISRVSVSYDVNRETEMETRTQFPLTVAYAITIHKCQGMSVNNALVHLSSTFEPGMMFVACSRVRSLNGLHIMGINARGFQANPQAYHEFGRLRHFAGMPLLPPLNELPPSVKKWPKRRKGAQKKTAEKETGPVEKRTTRAKATAPPVDLGRKRVTDTDLTPTKTKNPRDAETEPHFEPMYPDLSSLVVRQLSNSMRAVSLNENADPRATLYARYENGGSDCFLIVVIQMFRSISHSLPRWTSHPDREKNTFFTSFFDLIHDTRTVETVPSSSIRMLRRQLSSLMHVADGQESADAVVRAILYELSSIPPFGDLFNTEYSNTVDCPSCQHLSQVTPLTVTSSVDLPITEEPINLEEFFSMTHNHNEWSCSRCNLNIGTVRAKAEITVRPGQRFLVLNVALRAHKVKSVSDILHTFYEESMQPYGPGAKLKSESKIELPDGQLINADPEAVNLAKSELNAFARVNGVDVSAGRFFVSSSGRLTLSLDIDKERGVEGDLDGSFSGCEWRARAAIRYIAGRQNLGHFLMFVRCDGGWMELNDSSPAVHHSDIPENNAGIYTILLEKV